VQKEESRLLGEHVAVNRRHLDTILAQRPNYRVHLARNQNKVTGDGSTALAGRLKVDRLVQQ
jgi:hypothetical protein